MFFCQYDDPIYIKDTKLEIIFLLANEQNIDVVLKELEEYAMEIDVPMVCKSIRAIGNLSIKLESTSEKCVAVLKNLLSNSISYIVQEIAVIVKDIFRKFPNRFNFLIPPLIKNIDLIEEPESKTSIIWVLGEYSNLIDHHVELLETMFENIQDDTLEVKVTLLTAIMKVYVDQPDNKQVQELVIDMLKYTTEQVDDPDLRERGYFYWRLITASSNITSASQNIDLTDIIRAHVPPIRSDADTLPQDILEELELNIGTLASIYLRPVKQVFRFAKLKQLPWSPCLMTREQRSSVTQSADRSLRSRSSSSINNGVNDGSLVSVGNHLRNVSLQDQQSVDRGHVPGRSTSTVSSSYLLGPGNNSNVGVANADTVARRQNSVNY
ncbi:unnamed protein product [Ambrosiozyma monospora]|uniref:Unnamed protein product n=1 Tax=Ambrosiozyma monospora TaxID=43982 RepID=A0ACB5SU45_AMBMO|nr:unnamed protein product [Ambrosiozyma monospora]